MAEMAEKDGIYDPNAWAEDYFRNKIKEAQESINQKEQSLQKLPASRFIGLKTDNLFIQEQLRKKLTDLAHLPLSKQFKNPSKLGYLERFEVLDILMDRLLEFKKEYSKAPTFPEQGLRDIRAMVSESSTSRP